MDNNRILSLRERALRLLPAELRLSIPRLRVGRNAPDPTVHVRLYAPWDDRAWYVIEFDGVDGCLGLVGDEEVEFGTFSFRDIVAMEGPCGEPVERDPHFSPCPLSKICPAFFEIEFGDSLTGGPQAEEPSP